MTHAALPVDTRRFSYRHNGEVGFFVPNGTLTTRGSILRRNPPAWESEDPIWGARIFVGFSVGMEPRWSMEDAVHIVRRVRGAQVGTPDSSFLYQKGLYTHKLTGETVEEDGAQIVFINLPDFGATPKVFEKQMVEVAEALAIELEQEEVIVELQKDGITQKTIGVRGVLQEAG
jgi:hypothetical protein